MEASQGRKERLVDSELLLVPSNTIVLYYIIVDYQQLVSKNANCKSFFETTIKQLDDILHGNQDNQGDQDDVNDKQVQFTELVNMLVWKSHGKNTTYRACKHVSVKKPRKYNIILLCEVILLV